MFESELADSDVSAASLAAQRTRQRVQVCHLAEVDTAGMIN